ncbi:MAG: hypothetical protein Q8P81_00310 [Nanoarchaeota archaeon]|nr:hypothetical protein [Nanoarchaeota archaeon]
MVTVTEIGLFEELVFPSATRYACIELVRAPSIMYDENPTPLQRDIGMRVTSGRGYLSVSDALNLVNRKLPRLALSDVLEEGLIPMNPYQENVCSPALARQRTILEELRSKQKLKGLSSFMERFL